MAKAAPPSAAPAIAPADPHRNALLSAEVRLRLRDELLRLVLRVAIGASSFWGSRH
jgi:hypothetical protein